MSEITPSFSVAVDQLFQSVSLMKSSSEIHSKISAVLASEAAANRPHALTLDVRHRLLRSASLAALSDGHLGAAWSSATQALQLMPYDPGSLAIVEKIADLQRSEEPARLVLIISCQPRLERACRTKVILEDALGSDYRVLIVVGQTTADLLSSAMDSDLLMVEAPDDYESLPLKMRAAFEFVYRHFGRQTSCFKIDEDIEVIDAAELGRLMKLLVDSGVDYAGFAGNNKFKQNRTWHFGKCLDLKLGRRVYTKRFRGPWAYGGLYYLSINAVQAFVVESIRFPDEVLGEMYEDKYVGDVLREAGIGLTALDPSEWYRAIKRDWWTVNRAWDGHVLSLSDSAEALPESSDSCEIYTWPVVEEGRRS